MSKTSLDSTALASVLIAATAGLLLVPPGLTWLASPLGLLLLILLIAYDEEGYRSVLQSLAFAGTCAYCVALASIIPYQYIYGLPSAREPQLTSKWLPLTFAFTTLLICVIDRARMGARLANAQPGAATLGSVLTPRAYSAAATAVPATPDTAAAAPIAAVQPMAAAAPYLVRSETPVPPPAPAPPPIQLVEIYVHLTGESLNLMRSVLAEPLGRDYYRITDTMPENETWQFVPGQVVRCKKQNLSTGKAMVAIEEAPRAQ